MHHFIDISNTLQALIFHTCNLTPLTLQGLMPAGYDLGIGKWFYHPAFSYGPAGPQPNIAIISGGRLLLCIVSQNKPRCLTATIYLLYPS